MPSSVAQVATLDASRYAKQLVSHLGRKVEIRQEADGDRILVGGRQLSGHAGHRGAAVGGNCRGRGGPALRRGRHRPAPGEIR